MAESDGSRLLKNVGEVRDANLRWQEVSRTLIFALLLVYLIGTSPFASAIGQDNT